MIQNFLSRYFGQLLSFLLIAGLSFSSTMLQAQEEEETQAIYVQIDYMKVAPGMGGKYASMEKEQWKPIHQVRADMGLIRSWYAFEVISPSGSNEDYNYVTVNVFPSFEATRSSYPKEVYEKAFPKGSQADMEKHFAEARKIRTWVKTETFRYLGSTEPAKEGEEPAPFVQVGFMKATKGMTGEYQAAELGPWRKLHLERVKQGELQGWGFYEMRYPSGSSMPYDHITVNAYREFGDMEKKWMGFKMEDYLDEEEMEVVDKTMELRDMVEVQVWEMIEYARPAKKESAPDATD